jgi:hypothetical protein
LSVLPVEVAVLSPSAPEPLLPLLRAVNVTSSWRTNSVL